MEQSEEGTTDLVVLDRRCALHHVALVGRRSETLGRITHAGCPVCRSAQLDPGERHMLAVTMDEIMESRRDEAEIPALYRRQTLEDLRLDTDAQRQVCQMVRSLVEPQLQSGPGLILIGRLGTGKTQMACSALDRVLAQGLRGRYVTAGKLLTVIKEARFAHDRVTRSEREAYDLYLTPDLLVVDELGVIHGTAVDRAILVRIVIERVHEMRPTLLLANLRPDELVGVLGDQVRDRFQRRVAVCEWDSWRTQEARSMREREDTRDAIGHTERSDGA